MRAVIQTVTGKAEEEPIVELSATTTTPPVVVLGADPRRQRSYYYALAARRAVIRWSAAGEKTGLGLLHPQVAGRGVSTIRFSTPTVPD